MITGTVMVMMIVMGVMIDVTSLVTMLILLLCMYVTTLHGCFSLLLLLAAAHVCCSWMLSYVF